MGPEIKVEMGEFATANDKVTILETDGLGPCVAIAISANDGNQTHRFLAHAVMGEDVDYSADIKQFLKQIGKEATPQVTLASMQSFINTQPLAEAKPLVNKLSKMFKSYKANDPNFAIHIRNAAQVTLDPNGVAVFR